MSEKASVSIWREEKLPSFRWDWTREDADAIKGVVEKAINLVGGIGKYVQKGDKVMLKPNCVVPEAPYTAVNTDPRVMQSIAELCKDAGAKNVFITEFMRFGGKALFPITGMTKAARLSGATLYPLDNEPRIMVDNPGAHDFKKVPVPKIFLDMDVFMNVPKLKTHLTTVITVCIKNIMGMSEYISEQYYHRDDLHYMLVDMCRVFKPHLNIVDGIIALEGQAPMFTEDVVEDMNTIIVGDDFVAVDAVSGAVMDILPYEVPPTRIARQQGLGVGYLEKIDIKGKKIEEVKRRFLRALPDIIGYQRNDNIEYPVELYVGGACVGGCYCMAREALDKLSLAADIYKVPPEERKKLIVIMGFEARVPENLPKDAVVYILGDCASKYYDLDHPKVVVCSGMNTPLGKCCLDDWPTLYTTIGPNCIGRKIYPTLLTLRKEPDIIKEENWKKLI